MTDHPNAAKARQILDAFNTGDMQAMADGMADDVIWHEIGNPEPVRGKAALAERMGGGGTDYEITARVHDVVGNDDHVVALISATATRNGETFDYDVVETYHMRDGRITERWAFSDDTARITAFFG